MQLPLFLPECNWVAPRLSELPSWESAKRIAIDVETCDLKLRILGPGVRRGAYIVGVGFAIEDGPKYYLPIRHEGGGNMESLEQTLGYLRHNAKIFKGEIVGANLGYDLDFLWEEKILFPNIKRYRDIQVAEALINEMLDSYSLEAICNRYLGVGKDESILKEAANAYGLNAKAQLYMLPAKYAGAYGEADVHLPLLALRRQEKELDEQNLWGVYDLESDVLPVLVEMRRRGVRVDLDRLSQVEKWSIDEERKALDIVKQQTGIQIGLNTCWTADALVPALKYIGCSIPVTPKTKKPSIDKDFLSKIAHPVAGALQRARRVNKVRTTFVNSIRNHMTGDRIHCIYNQMRGTSEGDGDDDAGGAAWGRVSAEHPNLQQQPAKDPEIGPMWRSIYRPDEGKIWSCADYSTQEPRWTVHYAVKTRLGTISIRSKDGWAKIDADASAREVADRYNNDPTMDPHQMTADIAQIARKEAKEIFLGRCYGMGGAKLCRKLGLPTIMAVKNPLTKIMHESNTPEGKQAIAAGGRIFEAAGSSGQEIIDTFDMRVPFVRALSNVCERAASKLGYIRTQSGRKCRFPKDEMGNYDWTYKALNRLIQGSSADQTKRAMVALHKEGLPFQLQVHDEIDSSVESREEAEQIAKVMRECVPLEVPSRVDVEVGPSWGEVK